jgi:hypothetical protein
MLLTEPCYIYLGDVVVPSIELIPQPLHQMGSTGSSTITAETQSHISNNLSAVAPLAIDHSMTETLVLLAVHLQDTERIPKLLSWQDWCHNLAPDEIESVHALGRLQIRDLVRLEAHFLSHSATQSLYWFLCQFSSGTDFLAIPRILSLDSSNQRTCCFPRGIPKWKYFSIRQQIKRIGQGQKP